MQPGQTAEGNTKLFGNLCPVKTFTSCAISKRAFKAGDYVIIKVMG